MQCIVYIVRIIYFANVKEVLLLAMIMINYYYCSESK